MNKYPAAAPRASRLYPSVQVCLALLLGPPVAQARIGDTPEQMSARMLQPNLGRNFTWPKDLAPRDVERERRENPVTPFLNFFPTSAEDWREQIFWKSALSRQLSNDNGWRVHVYYLKGRSVLELYKRVGEPLNEFEVNAILGRLRGNQTWQRVTKKDNPDSVLGYDFELAGEEGATLRAKKQGDWLMIFHKRFDDMLVERKKRWEETEKQRKAELAVEQEKLAPVSVEGF